MSGENLFKYFITFLVVTLWSGFLIWWASPKHVHSYTLGQGYNNSGLTIRVDIENAEDDYIPLVGVGYKEAVQLVTDLNKTLPNED